MKDLTELIKEELTLNEELKYDFTEGGEKIKEGDKIWIRNSKGEEECVKFAHVNKGDISYSVGGNSYKNVPMKNFIESDKKRKRRDSRAAAAKKRRGK